MARVQEREVAWIAGFYEGEGTALLSKKNCTQVVIYNTDLWPLKKVRRLLGVGNITTFNRRLTGHKAQSQWAVYGDVAPTVSPTYIPTSLPAQKATGDTGLSTTPTQDAQ